MELIATSIKGGVKKLDKIERSYRKCAENNLQSIISSLGIKGRTLRAVKEYLIIGSIESAVLMLKGMSLEESDICEIFNNVLDNVYK